MCESIFGCSLLGVPLPESMRREELMMLHEVHCRAGSTREIWHLYVVGRQLYEKSEIGLAVLVSLMDGILSCSPVPLEP